MTPCQLFENIAETVWEEILENHPYGNRLNEDGLTRQTVVGKVQRYVRNRGSFSVFAQTIGDEVNKGSDMEVYIQNGYNSFSRILIQAKLSEPDGYFGNLKKKSGDTDRYQFDTLIGYGNEINCPTYYILYQGIPGKEGSYNDCKGLHDEKQFGCAIVTAETIKKHCQENNTARLNANEPQGTPWRILTCCATDYNNLGYDSYSKEEIDMDPAFETIFTPSDPLGFITIGQPPKSKTFTQIKNERLHAQGWNPASRIIMTQKPMYESGNILKIRN